MLQLQRPRRNGTKKVFTDFIVGDVGDHTNGTEDDEKPVTSDDESYTSEASQDEPSPEPKQMKLSRVRAMPVPSSTPSSFSTAKKPMRPLTAYHIFFQIEREFIIQSTPGADADVSLHDNKDIQADVPRRYRATKLSPDWFAGPGKRQKRKHRKSHGKIGFLELSRVISSRWATLDSTDPETKRYVTKIATRELDEYKEEMQAWKEATLPEDSQDLAVDIMPRPATRSAPKRAASRRKKRPISEVTPVPREIHSQPPKPIEVTSMVESRPKRVCVKPEPVTSQHDLDSISSSSSLSTPVADDGQRPRTDTIDYSICSDVNPYVPTSQLEAIDLCDPLFELDSFLAERAGGQRCVSPSSSAGDAVVDMGQVLYDGYNHMLP